MWVCTIGRAQHSVLRYQSSFTANAIWRVAAPRAATHAVSVPATITAAHSSASRPHGSPVGWSGNSNTFVQGSGHANTRHREGGLPLEFTLFTPTYRAQAANSLTCDGSRPRLTVAPTGNFDSPA